MRLHFSSGVLLITATNTEQEEANEEISMNYEGEPLEMGFNVNYLLDVLSAVPSGDVTFTLSSADNSLLLCPCHFKCVFFSVKSMRLEIFCPFHYRCRLGLIFSSDKTVAEKPVF